MILYKRYLFWLLVEPMFKKCFVILDHWHRVQSLFLTDFLSFGVNWSPQIWIVADTPRIRSPFVEGLEESETLLPWLVFGPRGQRNRHSTKSTTNTLSRISMQSVVRMTSSFRTICQSLSLIIQLRTQRSRQYTANRVTGLPGALTPSSWNRLVRLSLVTTCILFC